MSDASLKSPLAKVRGLGAAHEGTGHFILQRLSALALLPLVLWLVFSLARLPSLDYAQMLAWLASPFNALLLILFLGVGLYHAQLGVQVVLEDYISRLPLRMALIVAVKLLSLFAAVAGIFLLLKFSLGASA